MPSSAVGPAAAAASDLPSDKPTGSAKPSGTPSGKPSGSPSGKPSGTPSGKPSGTPSTKTSNSPVLNPTVEDLLAARNPAGYRIVNRYNDPDPTPGSGLRYRVATTEFLAQEGDWPDPNHPPRTGDLGIEITHVKGMAPGTTYQPNPDCEGTPNCTITHRPDGSVLMVKLPPAAGDLYTWQATLYGTDGSIVSATEDNSPMMGQNPVLLPLLDGDRLTALVLDPVWKQVVSSLETQFPH